ncbi:CopG domain protein DNA-binding domain protein, partial [Methylomonas albis]
ARYQLTLTRRCGSQAQSRSPIGRQKPIRNCPFGHHRIPGPPRTQAVYGENGGGSAHGLCRSGNPPRSLGHCRRIRCGRRGPGAFDCRRTRRRHRPRRKMVGM